MLHRTVFNSVREDRRKIKVHILNLPKGQKWKVSRRNKLGTTESLGQHWDGGHNSSPVRCYQHRQPVFQVSFDSGRMFTIVSNQQKWDTLGGERSGVR